MRNEENTNTEEVANLEQFQTSRSPIEDKEIDSNEQDNDGYSPEDVEYADGEGTLLNEALGEDPEDEDEDDLTIGDEDEDELETGDEDEDEDIILEDEEDDLALEDDEDDQELK